MARPRGVEDAVILRAAVDVIGRSGPGGLTLAAVAREVGLVPGTLVQRFGSKRGLLLALAEQAAREAEDLPVRARQGHDSPLAALEALLVSSTEHMATPEAFAHHLGVLCIDLTDPEFHRHALAVHRAQQRAVEALLGEAAGAGELRPGTDTAALAATVQAAAAGAGLVWALDRSGSLADRVRRELAAVLRAHQPHHPRPEER
ncbi:MULTISPECIES: TetR/AcrR family transcriptional regulator [Streptomyces]|uniref:TetR/AcrR family transcriptional regulator n=1 Tax=Streptomyces TaxID=1883 RepID=UPI0016797686|nr:MULTISPECIES: helix-turn-helix domain-containing protein [Streptomyces]MBD3575440.1 TetR/AcrR family transcriptional regulator [Streptomyces sp. KD18]GGS93272.1 TetR family transcriptional regulator [Streptomyces toxytricini]